MPFADIGPLTAAAESAAAAVAAGMVLGGFLAGLVGLMRGVSRRRLDRLVLKFGYGGGAGTVLAMIADITLRHAF